MGLEEQHGLLGAAPLECGLFLSIIEPFHLLMVHWLALCRFRVMAPSCAPITASVSLQANGLVMGGEKSKRTCMDELVSIIIPAYNVEHVIGDTIRSALNQTWAKKEIIIVDDGSKDNTFKVAKTFESNLVKVISQANRGASAARNAGLRFAQGTYIQWLDGDDLLERDKVACQLESVDNGHCSKTLLTSSFRTFYFSYQRSSLCRSVLWQNLSPVDWLINKFNCNVWMNPATWLVSRKLTELAGPWDERLVRDNDGEYICRVMTVSEAVRFVDKAVSYYRVGNLGSLSTSTSNSACESLLLSLDLCTQYLLSLEDSVRSRNACLNVVKSWVPFLYPDKKEALLKLKVLASQFGGDLEAPQVAWKYWLLHKCFGWQVTKRVMTDCRRVKLTTVRNLDWFLYKTIYRPKSETGKSTSGVMEVLH